MHEDLECKICFKVPRPEALEKYGICLNKGHIVCASCCQDWIDEMGNARACPFCRESPFELRGDNVLANKILAELAKNHMYPCYVCNYEFPGQELLAHEAKCSVGRYFCPLCSRYVMPYDMFGLKHSCFTSRSAYCPENQMWDKVLFFGDFFKKDSAVLMVHGELDLKLCLSYKTTSEGLSLNVFWIDRQSLPDPSALKIRVGAMLITEAGKLYRERVGEVHDFGIGDADIKPIPQLLVKMKDLAKWEEYSQKFVCTQCNRKRGHIHIKMDFE